MSLCPNKTAKSSRQARIADHSGQCTAENWYEMGAHWQAIKLQLLQIQIFEPINVINRVKRTVLPAKSDSDVMFCLQSYQGLRIDRSLVH